MKKLLSFAIVGGGPSGFYLSKQLLNKKNFIVHVFEKLPLPYGLIRYGVAPDHQSIKNAAREFQNLNENENFKYFGNIEIGNTLSVQFLKQNYSAIIYAYGAENDQKLNLEGEDIIKNIYGAKDIVNWYNGHPQFQDFSIDFTGIKNLGIIGNGNVALDISRILVKKQDLIETDISSYSYKQIIKNQIQNIFWIARRGPIQSAFSLKEFRALSKLVKFYAFAHEIERGQNEISLKETVPDQNFFTHAIRINERKMKFFSESVELIYEKSKYDQILNEKKPKIILRYLLTPKKLNSNKETGSIESVDFYQNILTGEIPFQQKSEIVQEYQENIPMDMLIRSIGYKSQQIDPEIPFDKKKNIISHSNGCILDLEDPNKIQIGKYVVGWIKTGPVGVLDQTYISTYETLNNIYNHIESKALQEKIDPTENILKYLNQINVKYIGYQDWLYLDKIEQEIGKKNNKVREKFIKESEIFQALSNKSK